MKIFPNFNLTGQPCPVCGTNEDKPCTLIPLAGTERDDGTQEATAVHVECIRITASDRTGDDLGLVLW
jgi:hypothetical protein